MDGNQPHQPQTKDFEDPFNAGQMVGMLVMLTFIENNKEVSASAIDRLKWICANNAAISMKKPTEDVLLVIDNLVKDIQI